jgi:hypothetical protein
MTRQPTSPQTMRQLSEQTLAEGLKFVSARRIAESLRAVAELYHDGTIDHDELGRRNRLLWDAATKHGVTADVKRNLRNA